jgi:hypothetical protein
MGMGQSNLCTNIGAYKTPEEPLAKVFFGVDFLKK